MRTGTHATVRRRQRRPAARAIALAAVFLAAVAVVSLFAISAVAPQRARRGGAGNVVPTAARHRPVYPYSVVPGGVESGEELKAAAGRDPVVAAHYADFGASPVRRATLASDRRAYVSFRVGDAVYWTRRSVSLRRGEPVLTNGAALVRARCGNRLSDIPRTPVSAEEPPETIMDEADRTLEDRPKPPHAGWLSAANHRAFLALQPMPIPGQPALRLGAVPSVIDGAGATTGFAVPGAFPAVLPQPLAATLAQQGDEPAWPTFPDRVSPPFFFVPGQPVALTHPPDAPTPQPPVDKAAYYPVAASEGPAVPSSRGKPPLTPDSPATGGLTPDNPVPPQFPPKIPDTPPETPYTPPINPPVIPPVNLTPVPVPVPEPGSLAMVLLAAAGLAVLRKNRRRP